MGVAIGPGSDEGSVRVNGVLLQAGRILPLAAPSYKFEKVYGSTAAPLASVNALEVLLFEHPWEMAVAVPRANATYAVSAVAVPDDDPDYTAIITIPFTGRSQARIVLTASAAPGAGFHKYNVWGRAYNPISRAVREFLLVDAEDWSNDDSVSIVVGGTDHHEVWNELRIEAANGDAVAITVSADVETADLGGR